MQTDQMLSVIAILRAYVTRDAEGIEVLIKDAPASGYADLLNFALMLIEFNNGDPVAYLDQMANGLMGLAYDDGARSN